MENFPFSSTAKIIKDPSHPSTRKAEGWIIGLVDAEICKYYSWWLSKRGCKVNLSAWRPHITIINGDKVPYRFTSLPKTIRFSYSSKMLTNGKHFWLPIQSTDIMNLRKEANCSGPPLHLTIGYLTHELPIWMQEYRVT